MRKAVHAVKQKLGNNMSIISTQLDQTMLNIVVVAMGFVEFYSPPGIIYIASEMGLRTGWSLSFTVQDVDG